MSNLKNQLIKIGNQNPNLRKHIKPVLNRITSNKEGRKKKAYGASDKFLEAHKSFLGMMGDIEEAKREGNLPPTLSGGRVSETLHYHLENIEEGFKELKKMNFHDILSDSGF